MGGWGWKHCLPVTKPRSLHEVVRECVDARWRLQQEPLPASLPRRLLRCQGFCSLRCAEKGVFSPSRWPSLMKHYSPTDYVNWLEEYKVRQKAGLEARKIVASFSKRFFSEHVSTCYVAQTVCACVCVCTYMCTHMCTRALAARLLLLVPFSMLTQSLAYTAVRVIVSSSLPSNNTEPFVPANPAFLKPETVGCEDQGGIHRAVSTGSR